MCVRGSSTDIMYCIYRVCVCVCVHGGDIYLSAADSEALLQTLWRGKGQVLKPLVHIITEPPSQSTLSPMFPNMEIKGEKILTQLHITRCHSIYLHYQSEMLFETHASLPVKTYAVMSKLNISHSKEPEKKTRHSLSNIVWRWNQTKSAVNVIYVAPTITFW